MCAPIVRSICTKLTNLESMQNGTFYLTSRDAKTIRRPSWWMDHFDRYFHQEHFATNQKSPKVMAQTVVLMFLMTLTLTFDLYSIGCHTI